MSVVVMFFAALAGFAGWWLARQRLSVRPWLETGVIAGVPDFEASREPAKRAALGFFLAVVGTLFALVIGAYYMRREFGDWQALPVPALLWLNTGALVLSSLSLEWAQAAARRNEPGRLRTGLAAAALFAAAFLGGQLLAWGELVGTGYYVATNPASSFFYLITGLHGLHVLGGLAALVWTVARAWGGERTDRLRLAVELCATYWLFMLLVWVVLFGLLAGWAGALVELGRQLLSQ